MAGLISIISDNISKLIVLPILSIIIIVLTYFLSKNNDEKIVYFYPSFIIGVVGIGMGIVAFFSLTSNIGLNFAWVSVILLSNSLIGILFAGILCLFNDIKDNYKQNDKARKNGKK